MSAELPATTKPWGGETLWARTSTYAAKILEIRAGHRTSLQHHEHKEETLLVLEGELVVEVDAGDGSLMRRALCAGETVHLPPGTVHRLIAPVGPVRLVEVSSPELDDVVRHDDDYGRATSTVGSVG